MNWIESQVRAVSVKRLLAAAIVLGIVIFALAANSRYIVNYFKGAYAMPREELNAATSAAALNRVWVKLEADAIHETGFQEITVRKKRGVERGRSVSASYYVAEFDKRLLLVKAHGDVPTQSLKGTLKPIVGKVDVSFFDSPNMQKIRPAFYPMMLDTEDYRSDGNVGFAVAGVAALISLGIGLFAYLRFSDPASHPAAKDAARWGKGKLDAIGAQIESQLKSPDAVKAGGFTVTPDYIVQKSAFSFKLWRTEDLLWVYKEITQNKMYYVIPTGKTYAAKMNFDKESISLTGKEEKVDALLGLVAEHKPWVIAGHSDEIAQSYKKNRKEMVAWVAQKKKELMAPKMVS
jgi:hypothetical protein